MGGGLFSVNAMFFFLRFKLRINNIKIVSHLLMGGFVSGGLGFGLGSIWMVFTIRLLLGAGLGLVVWLRWKDLSLTKGRPSSGPFLFSPAISLL